MTVACVLLATEHGRYMSLRYKHLGGQQDDSANKQACHQAWQLIPRVHVVEGENQMTPPQVASQLPHAFGGMCAPIPTHLSSHTAIRTRINKEM